MIQRVNIKSSKKMKPMKKFRVLYFIKFSKRFGGDVLRVIKIKSYVIENFSKHF